jgi:hypothetical protein
VPLLSDLVVIGAVGAGGLIILNKARGGALSLPNPFSPPPANQPPAPTQFTANQGANQFNFNQQLSWARWDNANQVWAADAGFGHQGAGGTFQMTFEARSAAVNLPLIGTLPGAAPGGWVLLAQAQFNVANDAAWTGYDVPFSVPFSTVGSNPNLFWGADVRFRVTGLSGELYQEMAINSNQIQGTF